MNNTRQPLLSEEKIQEMLAEAGSENQMYWLQMNFPDVFNELIRRNPSREIRMAFLRGKTKRTLNTDRLRADVKAWVDDPNRKYPEWMAQLNPKIIIAFGEPYLQTDEMSEFMSISYHSFYPYSFASIIGINPDDYFEEVEDGIHQGSKNN